VTLSPGFPNWTLDVRGNVDRDENNDEHFKSADSTTQSFARENTQNINDVRLEADSRPAHVRLFASGSEHALPGPTAAKYFKGFSPHLNASLSKSRLKPEALGGTCQFLVIEDFNTTGLIGDVEKRNESEGSENHFYGFFRSAGKSAKSSGGGSWGIGKIVNNMASSVGAFFGYSVRYSPNGVVDATPRVLMGRATLTTHELDGLNYSPDAFFAYRQGDASNAFTKPIIEAELLDEFVDDWQLKRGRNDSGLSIVVPFCEGNIDIDFLPFYLVAETYGFIVSGKQTLEIEIPGLHRFIDSDSLEQFCEEMTTLGNAKEWSNLLERVRLLKWAKEQRASDAKILLPQVKTPISFEDYVRILPDELKTTIHQKYVEEGRVLIHIPVVVIETPLNQEAQTKDGLIEVLVASCNEEGATFYPEYFRDWLRIGVGLRKRGRRERPMGRKISQMRSSVFISGGRSNGLAMLLRASEGIAHHSWDDETKGFKNSWADGETWVDFARYAPLEIADLARGITTELDFTVFPFFADIGEQRQSPNPLPRPRKPRPPIPPPTPAVRIEAIQGGFSLSIPEDFPGTSVEVLAAYERARGNAFSNWAPADFKFEALNVDVRGGKASFRKGNQLKIAIKKPDEFSVRVTGFDTNRDIAVVAKPGGEA